MSRRRNNRVVCGVIHTANHTTQDDYERSEWSACVVWWYSTIYAQASLALKMCSWSTQDLCPPWARPKAECCRRTYYHVARNNKKRQGVWGLQAPNKMCAWSTRRVVRFEGRSPAAARLIILSPKINKKLKWSRLRKEKAQPAGLICLPGMHKCAFQAQICARHAQICAWKAYMCRRLNIGLRNRHFDRKILQKRSQHDNQPEKANLA